MTLEEGDVSRGKKGLQFLLNRNSWDKDMLKREYIRRKRHKIGKSHVNELYSVEDIHVGELKIGKVYDVRDNNIYVRLKNENEKEVIIKRENNYLLEDELLYQYLFNANLIDETLYNRLTKGETSKGKETKNKTNDTKDCIVLIKEINENDEIIGELYSNEINKRKEKIYDKLHELKELEKRIFIKILKNVRNKYFIVLVNNCIKGYLLYDEGGKCGESGESGRNGESGESGESDRSDRSGRGEDIPAFHSTKGKMSTHKLSAYIVDVNKKLEYVFLSMKKYPKNDINEKIANLQHTIIIENLFENNFFKAEISDFCNDGNNIIVNIFKNNYNTIKVKIKSHNILNTKNILRNFDYLKNKIINYEFSKFRNNSNFDEHSDEKLDNYKIDIYNNEQNENNSRKRKSINISKKEYIDNFKKFKENFYGCRDVDALKYINVDYYIYKKEKILYVRIVNKTLDENLYEGSMKNADKVNQHVYNLMKRISSPQNVTNTYDEKLRYPSKVLGFFNQYVILSTRVLTGENIEMGGNSKSSGESNHPLTTGYSRGSGKEKDVVTLIEKRYIDYENLKEGDIFFCRFDTVRRRNIRNIFNLSNSTINKIFNSFFKKDKEVLSVNRDRGETTTYTPSAGMGHKTKTQDQKIFEELFFEKHDVYIMRGELHKDTEYRLNKNNVDKNFKMLKYICDTYYSGINKSYNRYPSIREEYILTYLGKDNYKLYRKIVADYFSSNKHSYKEFLQVGCEELATSIFDFIFENTEILTVEMVKNYNIELYEKIKKLNIYELNYLLKDLIKLKNRLHVFPLMYDTKIGRMNLTLNNQKPVKKEHILNLQIDEVVKEELLKAYKNFVYPIDYIKEIILRKKKAKCKENSKMDIIYILAEETINIYENSAKDVVPFTDEQISTFKANILKKRRTMIGSSNEANGDDFRGSLFDPENSQIRRILHMIKADLEKQKKKNKLDEVDREYEEEQKQYSDAKDLYNIFPQLEEMDKLSEDMFYMKLPFVE
ncbi:reticulocyte binding protein 2 homolog B [Plasmodium ovale curtisi]|uniref:Reticulocyte binding protein 2 homolog B n=1 Tax=Plasmodium ovale curtisi TaxID=864141 RepID=A0A1A8WUR1_PLAOA|nr:reticulocyte binding protein 2 homolog B [Plasmodium ovale curtisi]